MAAARAPIVTSLAMSWLLLASCSSDLCGDAASATNAIANKFASCSAQDPSNPEFFAGFSPCFDANACEVDLKSCSASDRSVLAAGIACQASYAANDDCTEAGLTTYNECVSGATDGGTALSTACLSAFTPQTQGSCSALADAGP